MTTQRADHLRAAALLLSLLVLVTGPAPRSAAQGGAFRRSFRDAPQVLEPLRDLVDEVRPGIAGVYADGRYVALGTVVEADGWIVTKASELEGELGCRLDDGVLRPAELVGLDEEFDLALLKIEASDLQPVRWNRGRTLELGQFVVSAGLGRDPLAFGIVGTLPRRIPARSGLLGILIEEAEDGARIAQVMTDLAASHAGLEAGDVIVAIDGTPVPDRTEAVQRIGEHRPGSEIRIGLLREGRRLELTATLGARDENPTLPPINGRRSTIRSGFPRALQHDSVLDPREVGGPLVDLDGTVVGVNIAREGRTATFAIPASEVRRAVRRIRRAQVH